MMLVGRITKAKSPWWIATCDSIGAFTQGRSRKDAMLMLADCIETLVDRPDFDATVTELSADGTNRFTVLIESSEPAVLVAEVLKYQRSVHRLSVKDVASKLAASSRSAYVRFEQGRSEPSLSALSEILGVVAPEMALVVENRAVEKRAPKRKAR